MDYLTLINEAKKAMEFAYVPYSKFKVGAALYINDGEIYTGCNIENVSFGATNCAERTAIFKAVSEGKRSLSAIAVVSSSGDFTPPCGICRQVMTEFSPDMDIILSNDEGEIKVFKINELLPLSFNEIK